MFLKSREADLRPPSLLFFPLHFFFYYLRVRLSDGAALVFSQAEINSKFAMATQISGNIAAHFASSHLELLDGQKQHYMDNIPITKS